MKTINDIKTSKDMVGIQVEFNPETITEEQKNKLRGLCKLMINKNEGYMEFCKGEKYFRLICNSDKEYLMIIDNSHDDCKTIELEDFLAEDTIEEKEDEVLSDDFFEGFDEVHFENIPRVIKDAENLVNKLTASVVELHELGKTLPTSKIEKLTKEINKLIKENK